MASTDVQLGRLEQECSNLRRELFELRQLVELRSLGAASSHSALEPTDFNEVIPEIIRITNELFPGTASIELDDDSEEGGELFTIINVTASGDPKEIVERRCRWHDLVSAICPSCRFRISIVPMLE